MSGAADAVILFQRVTEYGHAVAVSDHTEQGRRVHVAEAGEIKLTLTVEQHSALVAAAGIVQDVARQVPASYEVPQPDVIEAEIVEPEVMEPTA